MEETREERAFSSTVSDAELNSFCATYSMEEIPLEGENTSHARLLSNCLQAIEEKSKVYFEKLLKDIQDREERLEYLLARSAHLHQHWSFVDITSHFKEERLFESKLFGSNFFRSEIGEEERLFQSELLQSNFFPSDSQGLRKEIPLFVIITKQGARVFAILPVVQVSIEIPKKVFEVSQDTKVGESGRKETCQVLGSSNSSDFHSGDIHMMAASNADGYNSADALQLGSGNEVVRGAEGGSDGIEGATSTSMNGAADMASEAVRLASYKSWPHSVPVNPSALARAGFFYTGKDDIVVCFSCKESFKDWEYGDTAMGEHKSLSPGCKFVKGIDNSNDPLIKDMSRFAHLNVSSSQKENEDDDKGKGGTKENTGGKKGKKKKGKKKKGKKKQNDDDDDDDDDSSIFNVEDDPQFIEANRVLKSEYKRLLTFIYWPKNAPVLPEDLAKAGFYYCGSDDRVQCFCCYGILKNWRPGDSAMNEHRKYFPSCPFVRGEDVGNEPMRLVTRQGNVDDTPVKQTSRDPNRVENFQNQQQNQPPRNVYGASNTAAPQRSQTQSQHRHPEYADEDKRMATFSHWPSSDIVSSQELCRAGFYYTGIKDNVKCFHCDGGLRNWEPADEPWTEHARWFPKCEYILTERGSAFVNYVTSRYPRVPSSNPQASGRGQGRPQVNDVMRTDLVQVVLDMGYGKELVKKVVKRRINQSGESFRTTHDLLLAVWDEEEKMSRNRSHSDAQSDEEEDDQEDEKPGDGAAADPFRSNSEMSSASALNSPEDLQRELETLRDQKTCKVCMDRDVCMLFQPCGHLVTCEVCSAALRKCPICRNNIRSTLRTYMS